jgi:hypothetical protein
MSATERRIAELEADNHRLRQLLGETMLAGESLEVAAIVSLDGVPRVSLRWDQMATQMSTSDARMLALHIVEVAGWADQDSVTFTVLRDQFDERTAAGFMAMMRESRPDGSRERSG